MAEIVFESLSKRFGSVQALDGLTFQARAGQVTGFLGPNGAGKSTALRSLLGLVHPSSGRALIGPRAYAEIDRPWQVVGSVLDLGRASPGRTGRDHLRVIASAARLPERRADETLEAVGLTQAGGRRMGTYSTGMRQRLSLAAALLGDPEVLVLDEPANGLDPEGIAWLRNLLRGLAAEGRTVLVSSHVLSEIAQTVDSVVIISGGRLRFAGRLDELGDSVVSVQSTEAERLRKLLADRGFTVQSADADTLEVRGCRPEEVGAVATGAGIVLAGLSDGSPSLEAAFLRLTGGDTASLRPVGAGSVKPLS